MLVAEQQLSALKRRAALGFSYDLDLEYVKIVSTGFGLAVLESKLLSLHIAYNLVSSKRAL